MNILLIGRGISNISLKKELEKKHKVTFAIEQCEELDDYSIYKKDVNIDDYDLFFISPGIGNNDELYLKLKENNKPISSELEYALDKLKNNKIIAITGSNGKTTVASLLSYVLTKKHIKHVLAGNIGDPLINHINIDKDTLIILEVSSFQLERLNNLKPYISIITNITPNHLDRHTLNEYINLKKKIYSNQDNKDYLITNFNTYNKYKFKPKSKLIKINKSIIKSKYLRGNHNRYNINFVIKVLKILKIKKYIKDIKSFKGVKYRLEYLGKYNKTNIYNDAKSTTIYSTIEAIKLLKKNTLLILGGKNKNIDYSIIKNYKIKEIIIYGEEAKFTNLNIKKFNTLKDVFIYLNDNINNFKNILYSPGFQSLDQYKNYKERGKEFERLCKEYFNV